jgi:hypothetical protein
MTTSALFLQNVNLTVFFSAGKLIYAWGVAAHFGAGYRHDEALLPVTCTLYQAFGKTIPEKDGLFYFDI